MSEWTQATIEQYISDGIEESLTLDYKAAGALGRSDGKKKEITKDVSAMANSAGGLIIYGVKEFDEAEKRHLPEKIDAVDQTLFSKEWLEHIIGNIRPRIEGLRIYPVQIDSGQRDVVFVVEIPESITAHQAYDNRYYKRFNFESVAMEDYEVRMTMNRVTTPNLALQLSLVQPLLDVEFVPGEEFSKPLDLIVSITNTSPEPAMYYTVRLFTDKRLKVINSSNFESIPDLKLSVNDTDYVLTSYFRNYSPMCAMPIWEGESIPILPSPFQLTIPKGDDDMDFLLVWVVTSPKMLRKSGGAVLNTRNNHARLQNKAIKIS